MKKNHFIIVFIILVVIQILVCNYVNLSRFVVLSVLPVLILMLPLRWNNIAMMVAGFVLGFLVDFFSTGMLGLTSVALVPAALVRNTLVMMLFGDELGTREGELGVSRFGTPKFVLATVILCAVYFAVYVLVDSAGTCTFWEGGLRFLLSVLVSTLACVIAARILRPE